MFQDIVEKRLYVCTQVAYKYKFKCGYVLTHTKNILNARNILACFCKVERFTKLSAILGIADLFLDLVV